MPIQQRSQLKGFGQSTNEKYMVLDINDLINAENNSSKFGIGSNYVVILANGTSAQNGADLQAAYTAAIAINPNGSPKAPGNEYYILLAPGYYTLPANLAVNTNWVNLVSMTGLRDVFIVGSFTLNVTSATTYIQGIDTGTLPFTTSGTSTSQVFENCKGGNFSFGGTGAYGTYINCEGGSTSFGGNTIAGGAFTNCKGGPESFGGGISGTQATGIFKNCSSGSESFGGFNGTASGTFDSCSGGNNSFGGGIIGNASGIFTFCKLTAGSFPIPSGSGKFVYCYINGTPYNAGFIAQNNL
jgi:hypothetical protein